MLTGFTRFLRVATVALALTASGTVAADYSENARATAFVQKVVAKHGWDKAEITALLAQAQKQESVIKAIERPAESKSWAQYQDIFLIPKRIEGGVEFWNKHAKTLARAEQQFGVPAQIIVAILGVETLYGERMGTYRVIDTLVTQAFEFPADSWRARFGAEQLESLILLAKEQKFNPLELEGSYAGAMGYGQFIPTSYRAYAVDFDGDGIDDIWHNPVDAIGSIANYLKENGWRGGEDITVPAAVAAKADPAVVNRALKADSTITELEQKGYTATIKVQQQPAGVVELEGKNGQEFWLGLANYFVITTYNRSRLYAMAVYQLSEKIVSERNGDKS
jgi:membrane-bound lytic murein transglycosylase B